FAAEDIRRDIFLEEIEMVTARLLRKETGYPIIELAGNTRIVHPPDQPFHGHDTEYVRNPWAWRGVDLCGLPKQARDIWAGDGFVENTEARNRAAVIQGERRKVEG